MLKADKIANTVKGQNLKTNCFKKQSVLSPTILRYLPTFELTLVTDKPISAPVISSVSYFNKENQSKIFLRKFDCLAPCRGGKVIDFPISE